MTLLRWIHLRKLVPLAELLQGLGARRGRAPQRARPRRAAARARRTTGGRAGPAPRRRRTAGGRAGPQPAPAQAAGPGQSAKDAFLAEIRGRSVSLQTVVAQAQAVEFGPDRVTFTFLPAHRALREKLEQNRAWLESVAAGITGRKTAVTAVQQAAGEAAPAPDAPAAPPEAKPADLKSEALADTAVRRCSTCSRPRSRMWRSCRCHP